MIGKGLKRRGALCRARRTDATEHEASFLNTGSENLANLKDVIIVIDAEVHICTEFASLSLLRLNLAFAPKTGG